MKILFLIATLLTSPLLAQPDGFTSFQIVDDNGPSVRPIHQSGIITGVTRESEGVFPISIAGQPSTNYQVSVSDDDHPILWWIEDRSTTGFTLLIAKTTGGMLDPDVQCTVTVDLAPPEE